MKILSHKLVDAVFQIDTTIGQVELNPELMPADGGGVFIAPTGQENNFRIDWPSADSKIPNDQQPNYRIFYNALMDYEEGEDIFNVLASKINLLAPNTGWCNVSFNEVRKIGRFIEDRFESYEFKRCLEGRK